MRPAFRFKFSSSTEASYEKHHRLHIFISRLLPVTERDLNQFTTPESFLRVRKLKPIDVFYYLIARSLNCSRFGSDIIARGVLKLDVHRSSICRATLKISKQIFSQNLISFASKLFSQSKWHKHQVFAVDGTQLTLPFSKNILNQYPKRNSDGHYPKALLLAAFNAFTYEAITSELLPSTDSERKSLLMMLTRLPKNSILLLDRGFDGRKTYSELLRQEQNFIIRVRVIKKRDNEISRFFKAKFLEKKISLKFENQTMSLRLIRQGKLVLITNLNYSRYELLKLYKMRWSAETAFRHLKQQFSIEHWHSKTATGIELEVQSTLLSYSIICAHIFKAQKKVSIPNEIKINFTYTLFVFGLALINSNFQPSKTMLTKIVYTHQPGRSYPRYSKQPTNKWINLRKPSWKNRSKYNPKRIFIARRKNT